MSPGAGMAAGAAQDSEGAWAWSAHRVCIDDRPRRQNSKSSFGAGTPCKSESKGLVSTHCGNPGRSLCAAPRESPIGCGSFS